MWTDYVDGRVVNNSDTDKFRASKLIKAGTPPTEPEIAREIFLYGLDLEMKKCCEKNCFVSNKYRYFDQCYHDSLTERRSARHVNEREYHYYIHESTKTVGCTFTSA